MDRSTYFQAITTTSYVEFHRDSQTWPSQAHKSCADLAVIGCLCSMALQLFPITQPPSRTAALATARITGKWAMGKNFQRSAKNFSGHVSSQIITPVSTQAPASHCLTLRRYVLRGSVMVGSVAGRRVTWKCLDVFPTPSAGNYTFYTFSFHFKIQLCALLEGLQWCRLELSHRRRLLAACAGSISSADSAASFQPRPPPSGRTMRTSSLLLGSFLSRARKHLGHAYPE